MLGNCSVTVMRLDLAKRWFPGGPTGEWANGGPPSNAGERRCPERAHVGRRVLFATDRRMAGRRMGEPAHSNRPNRSAARISSATPASALARERWRGTTPNPNTHNRLWGGDWRGERFSL
jgi:hypothetical protein